MFEKHLSMIKQLIVNRQYHYFEGFKKKSGDPFTAKSASFQRIICNLKYSLFSEQFFVEILAVSILFVMQTNFFYHLPGLKKHGKEKN